MNQPLQIAEKSVDIINEPPLVVEDANEVEDDVDGLSSSHSWRVGSGFGLRSMLSLPHTHMHTHMHACMHV